eukprot:2958559-Rhodomonas_salina.3
MAYATTRSRVLTQHVVLRTPYAAWGTDGAGAGTRQEHAAGAVRNLAGSVQLKVKIMEADGLAPIIALTRSHSMAAQHSSLAALFALSFDSDATLKIAEYGLSLIHI